MNIRQFIIVISILFIVSCEKDNIINNATSTEYRTNVAVTPNVGPLPIFFDSTFTTSTQLMAGPLTQKIFNVDSIYKVLIVRKSPYADANIEGTSCSKSDIIIYWNNNSVDTLRDYYTKYYSLVRKVAQKPIKNLTDKHARIISITRKSEIESFFDWWFTMKTRKRYNYVITEDTLQYNQFIHSTTTTNTYFLKHKFR